MLTRRTFLRSAAIAGVMAPAAACSGSNDMDAYHEAAARLREVLSDDPSLVDFVRCATLAANSHNTQPWHFALRQGGVSITPDFSRRTPAVDPDDHHLYVTLGCAAENLLIAAAAHGRSGAVAFDGTGDGRIDIDLAPGPAQSDGLYDAIFQRQSTRSVYDGRTVPRDDLTQLENAARLEGVSVYLITEAQRRQQVLDFIIEGNTAQVNDPEFVRELKEWIRFNPSTALRTGDGLFSGGSGNPSLPTWLGRRAFGFFFTADGENDKYRAQLNSSAGLAIFCGDRQDKHHWVQVGRAFERFALTATALGIRHAHVNQPIEVAPVRDAFTDWLGLGGKVPDLVVRFGYAPAMPMSLRRPLADVVTPATART